MRLLAYEDAIYHRDADGAMHVERAFPTFMAGLVDEVEEVVIPGRVHPEPGASYYAVRSEVDFVPLPHYASLTHPVAVAKALGATFAAFWRAAGRVDIAWINGPGPMAVLCLLAAVGRRRPVVLGVRQNTMEYARRRYPGRRAALTAFRLLEALWRAASRRCAVIVVGPELARLYRHAPRRFELSVSFVSDRDIAAPETASARDWTRRLRVLSVGRLETEKNPLMLADVLARLDERWHMVVCGEGGLRDALERRLVALGVRDRCDLVGYVPLDRGLFDLYRSAHVFLHISWTEGLPQVLLEAFAARSPVVATAVGGVPDVAEGAALLIPPGDAGAAADALERIAADSRLRERLVAAGVERVRTRTTETQRHALASWLREIQGQ